MLCARTPFADSFKPLVGMRGRFSQVFLLTYFTAMVCFAEQARAVDPPPAGATSAKAVKAANEDELRKQQEDESRKQKERWLAEMWKQREEFDRNRHNALQEQRSVRDEIINTCGLSPENVLPVLLAMEKERFALQIETELKRVRREHIEMMMADADKRAKSRTDADAVLRHLTKLVDVRTSTLAEVRTQHESGTVPLAEVLKAEADLAESQIRAEVRREDLAKSAADAEMGRLAQEAREVSLDLTQDEMRLKMLGGKLEGLKRARGKLDEYTRIAEIELPAINRQLQEVQTRLLKGRPDAP